MKFFLKKERTRSRKKCTICAVLMIVGILALSGCSLGRAECYERMDTAMGTIIRETVYMDKGAEDITGQIWEVLTSLETKLLSRRVETAEIFQINETAGSDLGFSISEKLQNILWEIQKISVKSDGALDITIGETVRLWDMDRYAADPHGQVTLPAPKQIESSLQKAGYEKLLCEDGRVYLPEGMQLDLGAVGKGIACDEILQYLHSREDVIGAVISVGGSILTYGEKPGHKAWNVGIVDPHDTSSYIGGLTLEGRWCISTSGNYERYVEIDGVRYHHILDPATGYPADAGLSSVTVLCRDGLVSDALSTACFVLGVERSMPLLEAYGALAVFVDHQGNITLSPGMEAYFTKTTER